MAEDKSKDKKPEAKVKRPSALKRDLQNEKRRLRNRSFRSSVSTAIRSFRSALEKKDAVELVKQKLSAIYSLMDTGVKKHVFKPKKAARTKSRLTRRCAKV